MPYSTLITGPMWSSKTTKLLHILDYAVIKGKNCLIVVHSRDNRYSMLNFLQTHKNNYNKGSLTVKSTENIKIVKVPSLQDIPQIELNIADALFIDEGHFFPDICDFYRQYCAKKDITISALNCDHANNPFPEITKLGVWVDKVKRLNGSCSKCKMPSRITYKHSGELNEIIDCGGEDKYVPLCMKCYFEITDK